MKSNAIKNFLQGQDSIIISRLENGFLLTEVQFKDNGELDVSGKSFEENDDRAQDHVVSLLYNILEMIGECGSKHDAMRIRIGYEPTNMSVEEAKKITTYSIIVQEEHGNLL